MATKECECITKWKEDVRQRNNSTKVTLLNSGNRHIIQFKKMVNINGIKRECKRWYCDDSKDFKFCPLCGKELEDE